jgi:hypothetical protein
MLQLRVVTIDAPITKLHGALARRDTPEAVAELILAGLPPGLARSWLDLPLRSRIQHALKKRFGWSSMPAVFRSVVPMDLQVAKAQELALLFLGAEISGPETGDDIEAFLLQFNRLIGRTAGQGDFLEQRHNRAARAAMGMTLSRRRYDKLFRLACRLEDRLARLRQEERKHRLLLIAKSGLALDLRIEDLEGRFHTAAFVAYLTARMKLRSEFTVHGQQKPFDDLAAGLLKACERDPETNWYAIAHVFPRADILARLTVRDSQGDGRAPARRLRQQPDQPRHHDRQARRRFLHLEPVRRRVESGARSLDRPGRRPRDEHALRRTPAGEDAAPDGRRCRGLASQPRPGRPSRHPGLA